MLRWLLLGFLFYSLGTGLRDGWLIIKWSQLFHEIGFTSVDPKKPLNWSEFILNRKEMNNSKEESD